MRPRILFTSVPRPIGPDHGDGPSVGYELLHGQVTRAQSVFSPRARHLTFALDYIAANLDCPALVLHYPSRAELVRELRRGPEFVALSFVLATFHRMKEVVALVRQHAPRAKVILGGYGTVLDDEVLAPFSDHVCRGEGVAFVRELLGEPPRPMPYEHPLIVSRLRLLSVPVGRTGMIFAGLGCPHGCDFCCTSHFFRRRHIRLLPTGDDVFRLVERYLERDPHMSFTILDEDFLVARDRAERLRELVLARGTPLSIFAFATVKALSRISPRELLETGIDGVWIGYEGTRSGFAKQEGKPVGELIRELRSHGIVVLTSMIVGFDYQTPEIVREELAGLMDLEPALAQFLIYGPTPGSPFYDRVTREGRLRPDLARSPEDYYRACDGFAAMVSHPTMSAAEIEALQRECFETDFRTLGPSVVRSVATWFQGWKRYRGSDSPYLRAKAERWAREIRRALPIVHLAARQGPRPAVAARLEAELCAELGRPTLGTRLLCGVAPLAAAFTRWKLERGRFQHPRLARHAYRMRRSALRTGELRALGVRVERAVGRTIVTIEGALDGWSARRLARGLADHLRTSRDSLEVIVGEGTHAAVRHQRLLASRLGRLGDRLSIVLPRVPGSWSALAPLAGAPRLAGERAARPGPHGPQS